LSVLAMLALAMGERTGDEEALPSLRASLGEVPGKIAEVLARSSEVDQAAVRFQAQRRFICAGWGGNAANSYEVALKIKETSGCDTEGLQIEQLLHGPFCSVNSECLVTLMSPPGAGYERAKNIARASAEVGAPVWALVQRGDSDLTALATETFTLPVVDEFWSPLVYVAPLQLFTYYLALARGRHPDLFQQDNPAQAAARKHYDL
jgi:glucosamine--fructose-6-phosphate aminotransferase (isomerizing)